MPTMEAGPASPARPSSAAGGPQFRLGLGFFLVGRPDPLSRLGLLGRDSLYVRRDPVERTSEAHRFPLRLVDARFAGLCDHLLRLVEAVTKRSIDLLVGNLNSEPVRGRLEDELAGNRRSGLLA